MSHYTPRGHHLGLQQRSTADCPLRHSVQCEGDVQFNIKIIFINSGCEIKNIMQARLTQQLEKQAGTTLAIILSQCIGHEISSKIGIYLVDEYYFNNIIIVYTFLQYQDT